MAETELENMEVECDFCFEGEPSDPESWSPRQQLEFEVTDLQGRLERADKARIDLANLLQVPGLWDNIVRRITNSKSFYESRMRALQELQKQMPEPWRTYVCNILANGTPTLTGEIK